MKGLESGSSPTPGESSTSTATPRPVPGNDFPTSLAEALEILADRAKRHGLSEVVHLLEVAALAAREASPPVRPCQPRGDSAGGPDPATQDTPASVPPTRRRIDRGRGGAGTVAVLALSLGGLAVDPLPDRARHLARGDELFGTMCEAPARNSLLLSLQDGPGRAWCLPDQPLVRAVTLGLTASGLGRQTPR